MGSTTIITGVILAIFCIMIFVLVNRNKRNREGQVLLPLYGLAERENCKISRCDILNNSVIGIDESRNIVFVIRKINDTETAQVIHLTEMRKCRVTESSRTESMREGSIKVFDRINLIFSNEDKAEPDIMVEFYNSNTDRLTLTGELQLACKWFEIVNEKIAAQAKLK